MRKYVSSLCTVVSSGFLRDFFPLDMLLHWYRFNLVALVHNMHGIEMSIGTAFVLQSANRSSNSHKIGSLNIFQGERNLLIFYQ